MRKTSVFLLIMMLATLLLQACAAPTPQVIEKVVTKEVVKEVVKERPKLQVWVDHSFYSKGTDALFKSQVFEWAQQAGVDIEYQQAEPTVMTPRIDAALESKSLPDMLYSADERIVKIRRAGQLLPIDDLVADLDQRMGGFLPNSLAGVTYEGKTYGIPQVMLAEMLYVRKDLLEAAGMEFPKTWDEAFALAQKAHNPPTVWGTGMQVGPSFDAEHQITSLLWAYGGSIWSEDGSIALDSPATREVLAMIKKYWDAGLWPGDAVTGDDAYNNKLYQTGKAAWIYNTGSVAKWLAQNDKELYDNTVFGPPPAGPKGRFANGITESIVVPNTGKNIELVKDLIRYLNDEERYKAIITEMSGFRVPVYQDLKSMDMWKGPTMTPLIESAEFTYPVGWPGPVADAALQESSEKLMTAMVGRVLVDGWTADQAIAEAVQKLEQMQARAAQ